MHSRKHSEMALHTNSQNRFSVEPTISRSKEDLRMLTVFSAKKSKTPHRNSKTLVANFNTNERTLNIANKLKKSVFELTREETTDCFEQTRH